MIDFVIAVVLAGLRIGGEHGEPLQAAAHLYTGWLARKLWMIWKALGRDKRILQMQPLWIFVGLCVVEVACVCYYGLSPRP